MINLLPYDYKQGLAYAQRNSRLRKWVLSLAISVALSALIIAAGFIYLRQLTGSEEKSLQAVEARLANVQVEETQKELDGISSNIRLALDVLSKEILFSELMQQLGASLPANTVLKQMEINELEGGITLNAAATNFNSAAQIQINLEDPDNKIFAKADIENINCDDGLPPYPCSVQIKALFSENNQFSYIPTKRGGSRQ